MLLCLAWALPSSLSLVLTGQFDQGAKPDGVMLTYLLTCLLSFQDVPIRMSQTRLLSDEIKSLRRILQDDV